MIEIYSKIYHNQMLNKLKNWLGIEGAKLQILVVEKVGDQT